MYNNVNNTTYKYIYKQIDEKRRSCILCKAVVEYRKKYLKFTK